MIEDLKTDIDRYVFMSKKHWLSMFFMKQGLWILTQYRVSRWVDLKVKLPVVRQILKVICALWQKLIEILTNSEFPNKANIGKGIYMAHGSGIVLHNDLCMGEYCNIGHQVTIGYGGRGDKSGVPKVGDRVFIGPGAKIFGPIVIGNDVAIGANAVVTKDLPDNAVAVGIHAQIISYKGSQDYIFYRNKKSTVSDRQTPTTAELPAQNMVCENTVNHKIRG